MTGPTSAPSRQVRALGGRGVHMDLATRPNRLPDRSPDRLPGRALQSAYAVGATFALATLIATTLVMCLR